MCTFIIHCVVKKEKEIVLLICMYSKIESSIDLTIQVLWQRRGTLVIRGNRQTVDISQNSSLESLESSSSTPTR
jgi:hypothetical protein